MVKVTTSKKIETAVNKAIVKTVSLLGDRHKKVWFISDLFNILDVKEMLLPKLGYDPDNLMVSYIATADLCNVLKTPVEPTEVEIVICLDDSLNLDMSFIPNNIYVFHT